MSKQAAHPDLAKLLQPKQADAFIAALRLLQTSLQEGRVTPNDGDIGDILTSDGAHEGLAPEEIDMLLAESFGIF